MKRTYLLTLLIALLNLLSPSEDFTARAETSSSTIPTLIDLWTTTGLADRATVLQNIQHYRSQLIRISVYTKALQKIDSTKLSTKQTSKQNPTVRFYTRQITQVLRELKQSFDVQTEYVPNFLLTDFTQALHQAKKHLQQKNWIELQNQDQNALDLLRKTEIEIRT